MAPDIIWRREAEFEECLSLPFVHSFQITQPLMALARLTVLSKELAENSSVGDPLTTSLEGTFGNWKKTFCPF